jgi:hypothetical protein
MYMYARERERERERERKSMRTCKVTLRASIREHILENTF